MPPGELGQNVPRGLGEVASSMVSRKWMLPKAKWWRCISPSFRLHCDLNNAGQDRSQGWASPEFMRNTAWSQEHVLSNEFLLLFYFFNKYTWTLHVNNNPGGIILLFSKFQRSFCPKMQLGWNTVVTKFFSHIWPYKQHDPTPSPTASTST